MKSPLHAGRNAMTVRGTPWGRPASGPAPDPRFALAVGLIAALALALATSSFAQQADTSSSEAGAPVVAEMSDTFPFAHNGVPESFPSVGVSVGGGGYLSSFAAVERAFRAIEDVHRAAGYPVPSAQGVRTGPLVVPGLKVRFNRWLDVGFQMVRSGGAATDKMTLIGGLVSGRTALSPGGKVSLFAGVGGGTYRFSFRRAYGVRVSANDGYGGYYELEDITLVGGGGYWTTAGGLTLRAFPRGALEAQIQYFGTDDVSTDTAGAGEVRLNMSGATLALSIVSFF